MEIQLDDPVYRTAVRIMVGSYNEVQKLLNEWDIDIDDTSSSEQGRLIRIFPGDSKLDPSANMTLIWLRNKKIPCLVHELSHHVIRTFDEKQIPINWDNTEVFAYYLEYLTQQVLDKWKKPKAP